MISNKNISDHSKNKKQSRFLNHCKYRHKKLCSCFWVTYVDPSHYTKMGDVTVVVTITMVVIMTDLKSVMSCGTFSQQRLRILGETRRGRQFFNPLEFQVECHCARGLSISKVVNDLAKLFYCVGSVSNSCMSERAWRVFFYPSWTSKLQSCWLWLS